MKYHIQNIVLKGNEHGKLKPDVIYAELVNENGETEMSATLDYILAAIRDRNLEVEGVTVNWREYRGAKNSEISLDFYNESSVLNFSVTPAKDCLEIAAKKLQVDNKPLVEKYIADLNAGIKAASEAGYLSFQMETPEISVYLLNKIKDRYERAGYDFSLYSSTIVGGIVFEAFTRVRWN